MLFGVLGGGDKDLSKHLQGRERRQRLSQGSKKEMQNRSLNIGPRRTNGSWKPIVEVRGRGREEGGKGGGGVMGWGGVGWGGGVKGTPIPIGGTVSPGQHLEKFVLEWDQFACWPTVPCRKKEDVSAQFWP